MIRFLPLLVLALAARSTAAPLDADVVIYGGNAGAIVAAVQTKNMGKSVRIVAPEHH